MLTFNTQEEFEDAVMEVIRDRLQVGVSVGSGYYDYCENTSTRVAVELRDTEGCVTFSTARDNG
jgi:hypothetical protein